LTRTDVTESVFGWTQIEGVDLSSAIGLENVLHNGPSAVDIGTIFRSGGRIPERFLRGVGVPELLITYIPSLVTNPLQFYSVFISYSTGDQEFAQQLHSDLQAHGVRCWFAPHDAQGGKKLHEQIDSAIRVYDRLLLILSDNSMQSEWVATEIAKARRREKREGRQMLFPIRLVGFAAIEEWECFDADTGKDSAREIREYLIPDFSNWKKLDEYRASLKKLLRDLKPDLPDIMPRQRV
jgi:hypothetical protein